MAHDRFSGLGSRILQHNILESFMHVYHNKPVELVHFRFGLHLHCHAVLVILGASMPKGAADTGTAYRILSLAPTQVMMSLLILETAIMFI